MINVWIKIEDKLPQDGTEVLGYSKKWIHPDFNPKGIRVCFINEGEWISSKWDNDQDSWHTHAKWCCEDNGGKDFEPESWISIPNSHISSSINDLAKSEVNYERQIAIFGKEKADTALQMWILGYIKSQESLESILNDLYQEIKHGDEEHMNWLNNKIDEFYKSRSSI